MHVIVANSHVLYLYGQDSVFDTTLGAPLGTLA
jgi:hypothetical protein